MLPLATERATRVSMQLRKPVHRRKYLAALVVLWIGVAAWNVWKPAPQGLGFDGPARGTVSVEFLADWTWVDEKGQRTSDHHIFERKLELIGQAERLVVLDMFLFNEFAGDSDDDDLRLRN